MDVTPHMDWLYRQALALCRHTQDAQELTQETLLQALPKPEPRNPRAFLRTILRRRHADLLRHRYQLPTVSIDAVPEMAAEETPDADDAARVRQAVAYLSGQYREAMVRHYLHGESTAEIARSLGIPRGTVLSRLSGGRDQIRKGWNDMVSYGRQSCEPERLEVSCNGRPGRNGEPWTLVAGDLLKQNILLAAYDEPVTPVDIARSLGVPAAYVEAAVDALVEGQLMRRTAGRVCTDFLITTPAQRQRGLDCQVQLAQTQYVVLMAPVRAMAEAVTASPALVRLPPEEGRMLREYFMVHLLSTAIFTAITRLVPAAEEFPDRPDGGRWIASGYRVPMGFDWAQDPLRRYTYGGERIDRWEPLMDAKSVTLRVYDVQPHLNRYQHGPVGLDDAQLCRLLYMLHRGCQPQEAGIDPALMQEIPHLTDCGVLRRTQGRPACAVPVVTRAEYSALDAVRITQLQALAQKLEGLLRPLLARMRAPMPRHLRGRVAQFRRIGCFAIPMALREEAVRRGEWQEGNGAPAMVLVEER